MKVAALCPTYKRPRELANAIECFLRQDYPAELRELIVLDDAGQYTQDAISIPGVKFLTTPHRFRTLGEKRNASAGLAAPEASIYCVWDDDDVYLPWHITAAVKALERSGADYAIPTVLYTQNPHKFDIKTNRHLFHGAWAFRREAFEQVGGYPFMQSGQDQGLRRRFEDSKLRCVDAIQFDSRPSYIYRWGTTPCGWHISGLDKHRGYEQLASKAGELINCLKPQLETDWLELITLHGEPSIATSEQPVSIIVPWREIDQPRALAWDWVSGKLRAALPNAELILAEDGGDGDAPFSRSRAVMNGAARAAHDLLVVTDADVWSYGLLDGIKAVADGAPWATPHTRIHRLAKSVTLRLYAGHYPTPRSTCERPPYVGNLGGGLVIVTKQTLAQVPFDRRFQGWGREDDAWQMAVIMLLPHGVRFEHPLYHLWHPAQTHSGNRTRSPNQELFLRYRSVADDPVKMQLLLSEVGV